MEDLRLKNTVAQNKISQKDSTDQTNNATKTTYEETWPGIFEK